MRLITRDELKEKLDRGDDFKLVMVLSEWAYRAKHIPGSLSITAPEQALQLLQPDDEIVLYCSNPSCPASPSAYDLPTKNRYSNVRRYAGGTADWEEAGLPLEGEMVD